MSEELDTNVTDETDVSGNTNDKSETAGNTSTDNGKTDNQEKKLTQAEVNEVVKKAKRDAENAAKIKLDKSLEGKIVLTEKERDDLIKDAVTAALKEESLKSVRAKLQAEYGLSDYQISKLEGDDEKSLKDDAEKTYGKIKKEAPLLNSGSNNNRESDVVSTLAQRTQQQLREIKNKHHVK